MNKERTLMNMMQECRHKKDADAARCLYAYVRDQRLDSHPVLCNYLIPMLADCDMLQEAQCAFDCTPSCQLSENSWTSLISCYINHGKPHISLELFLLMQQGYCAQPSKFTFSKIILACASIKDEEMGRMVHAEAIKRGMEMEIFVGTALVNLYIKCSLLRDAHQVFDRLPVRDAVTWTSLITGHVNTDFCVEVLYWFQEMQIEGLCVDASVFVGCLKSCSSKETGRWLHLEAVKRGLEKDLHVGSALVNMYLKYGSPYESHTVLGSMLSQNTVLWNTLIAGYTEIGLGAEVLGCFREMGQEGTCPDSVTFMCTLKACSAVGDLEAGHEIHSEVVKFGLETELKVGNKLVDVYAKCGSPVEAYHVFWRLPVKNEISWNSLCCGYIDHGYAKEVLDFLSQMQHGGICVNAVMLVCSLKACGATQSLETGQSLHIEIVKRGLDKDLCVGNTLVDMYGKWGTNTEAFLIFSRLPVKDGVSWNALITGYGVHGLSEEVLACFKRMLMEGVSCNAVTLILCLKACGNAGGLETAREIHAEIRKAGLERDPTVAHVLIDTYGKCGAVSEGREVFQKLEVHDTVAWNTMIKAYGDNHEGKLAICCFEDMQKHVMPDSITFTSLLAACGHSSLVLKGEEYFKMMIEKHKVQLTMDHYGCMVDILARSGHLCEAVRLVAAMQCLPSSVVLVSLLSACKMYGKLDLGQVCFQQLVEVNQEDGAVYSLMAGLYAINGRWSDANRVEEMRNYAKAKKTPGSAIIEVNRTLHKFVVGTIRCGETHAFLKALITEIKAGEYIPNLEFTLGDPSYEFVD